MKECLQIYNRVWEFQTHKAISAAKLDTRNSFGVKTHRD